MLAPNLKNVNVVLWEAKGDPGTLALEGPLEEALRTLRDKQPGYYNFRNYIDPEGHMELLIAICFKTARGF